MKRESIILICIFVVSSCVTIKTHSPEMDADIFKETTYVRIQKKIISPSGEYLFKVKRYNKNKVLIYNTPNTEFIVVDKESFEAFSVRAVFYESGLF